MRLMCCVHACVFFKALLWQHSKCIMFVFCLHHEVYVAVCVTVARPYASWIVAYLPKNKHGNLYQEVNPWLLLPHVGRVSFVLIHYDSSLCLITMTHHNIYRMKSYL